MLMGAVSKVGGMAADYGSAHTGMIGGVIASSVVSGTIDEIGGGKFANGAITGAFSYLFNETLHKTPQKKEEYDGWDIDYGIMPQAAALALTLSQADTPAIGFGDALGALVLAGAAVYNETQRIWLTYTLTGPNGQIYVGRASGFGSPQRVLMHRFYGHKMRLSGFSNPKIDVWAQGMLKAYSAIRGREQQLMDKFGGVGSKSLANKIRGVSKINPAGRRFHLDSCELFGKIAPFTGY